MKRLALFLTAACCGACMMLFGQDVMPVRPVIERRYDYIFDTVQQTRSGEALARRSDANLVEGYRAIAEHLPEPSEQGVLLTFAPIAAGSEWLVIGKTADGSALCRNDAYPPPVAEDGPVDWPFCLVVNSAGEPYGYAYCSDRKVIVRRWSVKPANFLKRYPAMATTGSVTREIVYLGGLNDTVRLAYREFRDGRKRPSYERFEVLDLSKSSVVTFRGMRIELIEATGASIRYVVKTPFD